MSCLFTEISAINSHHFILESTWTFVPNLQKFLKALLRYCIEESRRLKQCLQAGLWQSIRRVHTVFENWVCLLSCELSQLHIKAAVRGMHVDLFWIAWPWERTCGVTYYQQKLTVRSGVIELGDVVTPSRHNHLLPQECVFVHVYYLWLLPWASQRPDIS